MLENLHLQVTSSPDEAAWVCAGVIGGRLAEAQGLNGTASVAFSGGKTPATMLGCLAERSGELGVDWSKVHVFLCDERCVPPDSPESNFRTLSESLLGRVPVQAKHVHAMFDGRLDCQAAADAYDRLLRRREWIDGLDVAVLGLGDDGHTASLFPGSIEPIDRSCLVAKSPTGQGRLSLSSQYILRCGLRVVLVTGSTKARVVAQALEGAWNPRGLPIHRVVAAGDVQWIMDAQAAGMEDES